MSIKIAIDAGHGSNTAGKRTAPFTKDVDIDKDGTMDVKKGEQYREHYASVLVCNLLKEELEKCGFITYKSAWNDLNGRDDIDVPLTTRQKNIKNAKCDYSVSVHFNAHGNGKSFTTAQGIETLIHSTKSYVGDSKKLAEKIQAQLIKNTKQTDRGVKSMELAMCNCIKLGTKGSVLVELAFMTNEREAQDLIANYDFCKECSVEICKGFCDYCGIKYVEDKKKETTTTTNAKDNTTFKVRILADVLNVRKEPNSKSDVVTKVNKNQVYTITETKGLWYKLKSGAGWIYGEYVEKV